MVSTSWQLKLLIDGACPVCRREADFLRRLDRGKGKLAFEDISKPEFNASDYGLTHEQVMNEIHAVTPRGNVVTGMDVFRRAYALVGLGWILVPTRWPGLRQLSDRAYRWFARNRTRIPGRVECHTCASSKPES